MNKYVLTKIQMYVFGKLGIDITPNWNFFNYCSNMETDNALTWGIGYNGLCRTFTLENLIELLPENIGGVNCGYELIIQCKTIIYAHNDHDIHSFNNILHETYDEISTLNAAYDMLIWLYENNYLKINK